MIFDFEIGVGRGGGYQRSESEIDIYSAMLVRIKVLIAHRLW
jgi:hypothetical protein